MITRTISAFVACILLAGSPVLSPAASDDSPPLKDLKGSCLVVAYDASEFSGKSMADFTNTLKSEMETTAPGSRLVVVEAKAKTGIEKSLSGEKADDLGAVVIMQPSSDAGGIRAGVYHYAFDSIDGPHVPSPEYSFKFASDSALLAICLSSAVNGVDLEPARKWGSNLSLSVCK